MATITFCGESFIVDHAVKGADYVHGYDANGNLIISLDGVKDFSGISYDGTYMPPTECLAELCNDVKYCAGAFKKSDGTVLFASENGCYYRLIKSLGDDTIREWVNPPMVLGVEYRTTERWNGKVVYAVNIAQGKSASGTTVVDTTITATDIVRVGGAMGRFGNPFIHNTSSYSIWGTAQVSDGNIRTQIHAGSNATGLDCNIHVWYTKN